MKPSLWIYTVLREGLFMAEKVIPLIIAGGKGSRFWPLSREQKPKQFLALDGSVTLLERTFIRAEAIAVNAVPYIIAGADQYEQVMAVLPKTEGVYHFISEPEGKNTAAAVYWASCCIREAEGDGIIVVLPADHFIDDLSAFVSSAASAVKAAEVKNTIVLMGISPKYPATGYGYIERGKKERVSDCRCCKVRRFVEKPHRKKAKRYLKEGTYLWNSGISVFPLSVIFSIYQKCLGNMTEAFDRLSIDKAVTLQDVYHSLEGISFDYGILERYSNLYVVPADFKWDDVGSYSHLGALIPPDKEGNICKGNCALRDTSDAVVLTDNLFTAVIGLKDVVIAENQGVLLVCHRSKTEEIRHLVDSLPDDHMSLR